MRQQGIAAVLLGYIWEHTDLWMDLGARTSQSRLLVSIFSLIPYIVCMTNLVHVWLHVVMNRHQASFKLGAFALAEGLEDIG